MNPCKQCIVKPCCNYECEILETYKTKKADNRHRIFTIFTRLFYTIDVILILVFFAVKIFY